MLSLSVGEPGVGSSLFLAYGILRCLTVYLCHELQPAAGTEDFGGCVVKSCALVLEISDSVPPRFSEDCLS
ncbi:hypothetical protein PoB_001103800 [Plakobranchus ocellatus]|uniref:Uncharacterized protein n=1 Tax=Plakobranchus ocellatus TaxID=259542 RepID=A0AAV3YQK7_9GAST|nr:hypothetical protein PoB_001103800 [Plakobranchus ocellatus]